MDIRDASLRMDGEVTWLRFVFNGRLCIRNAELSASAISVILCLKDLCGLHAAVRYVIREFTDYIFKIGWEPKSPY
jgi:hypothetical protein